jgi:acid phosphatase family membrane protein YuiD
VDTVAAYLDFDPAYLTIGDKLGDPITSVITGPDWPTPLVNEVNNTTGHIDFVTALSVSIGLWNGFDSDLFAVACVFSAIVIYDAYRLRGTVERHARALKALLTGRPEVSAVGLTDMVGHTPVEIAVGIAAGGGFAALVYLLVRQL